MDQDIEDEDVVVPLRLISSIICFKIVEATKTYFVEAIATVNEAKIKERLPWVFNGYKPIKVDQGLDSRIICGITATWNATSGQKLDVRQISDAQPSVNSETEVDLHIGLWVERGVVEKLAPSLLDNDIVDYNKLPQSKREAGLKLMEPSSSPSPPPPPPKRQAGMKSAKQRKKRPIGTSSSHQPRRSARIQALRESLAL